METVIIYQPYLSTRKLSSNTIDRQFRFLTNNKNIKVYALFSEAEKDYVESLQSSWFEPIIENIDEHPESSVKAIMQKYNFSEMYVARTYFTPCTSEDVEKHKIYDGKSSVDWRIARNYIPISIARYGVTVNHLIYDPLELKYDDLIDKKLYKKYSSMINVDGALPHLFADFGYFDKNKEISKDNKNLLFVFGGTSFEENREALLEKLYSLNTTDTCKIYIRTRDMDNLIPNEQYEDEVSRALFTYVLPSYSPKHMSFTRMLLALSQGTIPLIHPQNNLDCLFGRGFEMRESLRPFFKNLIMFIGDVKMLLKNEKLCNDIYNELLSQWHNTDYYKWLKDRV